MAANNYAIPFEWWRGLLLEHPNVARTVFPKGLPVVFRMQHVKQVNQYIESEFAKLVREGGSVAPDFIPPTPQASMSTF